MSKSDALVAIIGNGPIDEAVALLKSVTSYHEAEELVHAVLDHKNATAELTDAVLETFLNSRENTYQQHGYWVHSLSHFTDILWERRMDGWIKKFHEVAFKGATELMDPNCSDRLVSDFAKYSTWSDNPADFHLCPENLTWMKWQHHGLAKARIKAGRFEYEKDYLVWMLNNPPTFISWDGPAQADLIDNGKVQHIISQLKDMGVDTSEFETMRKTMLTEQLNNLEQKLNSATQDWQRERLQKGIEKTRAALA